MFLLAFANTNQLLRLCLIQYADGLFYIGVLLDVLLVYVYN